MMLGSILAITIGACDTSTEPEKPVLSARDAFALDLAAILCEAASPCCSEKSLDSPGDGCTTTMRNEVFVSFLKAEDEQQEVTLDEADACLDVYRQATAEAACDALPHPRDLPVRCPMIFGDIPVGHLKPNDACEHIYECSEPPVGERNCFRRNFNESSHCIWVVPVESGGTCSAPAGVFMVCPEGEGCLPNETNTDLVCATAAQQGELCVADNSCAAGLSCKADSSSCERRLEIGDYCGDWLDGCVPDAFCGEDMFCDKLPILAACEDGGCQTQLDTYCDP